MPGGAVADGTPVPVGPAAPVPPLGVTTTLAPGIGYGAMAGETITDGSADDSTVGETMDEETIDEEMINSGNDGSTAAFEILDVEVGGVISTGMISAGAVDSPSSRVEVTVASPTVIVSVMVEVVDMVVVGSVSGAPASRVASDRRGRARRAEVSETRMVVVEAQTADTQNIKINQNFSVSQTVDLEKVMECNVINDGEVVF
ncbi:MAG: hypothetical protein LQ341_000772 [Variospora aurantia]|nr:MAG: hypothetical protein LQ341_000772 [Variospora aurantia]